MIRTDDSTIGGRIRIARKKKGWSQDNLAEELNVTKALISQYETGKIVVPTDRIVLIANMLQVTAGYLLNNEKIIHYDDQGLRELISIYVNMENDEKRRNLIDLVKISLRMS